MAGRQVRPEAASSEMCLTRSNNTDHKDWLSPPLNVTVAAALQGCVLITAWRRDANLKFGRFECVASFAFDGMQSSRTTKLTLWTLRPQ